MINELIARLLLQVGAVTLQPDEPFTWSSGMRSPIYCDNRITLSFPDVREVIAEGFRTRILEQFGHVDVIAGTATGGIAHAAWVAQKLNLPMVYVRTSAKGHGKRNQVEGIVRPGQRVVLIEDLISTGGSCLSAAQAIDEVGGTLMGIGAIFSYGLASGIENFRAAGRRYFALSDYPTLLRIAREEGSIDARQLTLLEGWMHNPEAY